MYDLHIHTNFSFDSEEQPENYLNLARSLNVGAIGFSEHYDYDAYAIDGERRVVPCDIDRYVENIERLKKAYPDLQILCGIEFGYRAEAVEKHRELIKKYKFDYVINSLHTLPGRGDCYHDRFFEGYTLKQSYSDYFDGVLESVTADFDFNIVGHLGYVSRYRKGENVKIRYIYFAEIIDKILIEIIKRDKCLEINASTGTSGSDFLPDKDIIERYIQLGGKNFSFGSDAHRAADYMRGHDKLSSLLHSLNINSLCYYKLGKKINYLI